MGMRVSSSTTKDIDCRGQSEAASRQPVAVRPADLGENVVDAGVHQAIPVPVLGDPQDLWRHGGERRNGDVHVVPGWHVEQGGDSGSRAAALRPRGGHTEVSLRRESRLTPRSKVQRGPGVLLTLVSPGSPPSGWLSE